MVHDPRLGRDVKKNDWEMELFGTGKQVAIPPSIHPDTGKAYVWKPGVEIDPEDLDLGLGPTVSPSLVASWGAQGETASGCGGDDEDDDEGTFGIFEHALRFAPMGLTQDEIDGTLAKLPEDWVEDRDRWLEVGQALHHEYKGSVEGFCSMLAVFMPRIFATSVVVSIRSSEPLRRRRTGGRGGSGREALEASVGCA